MIVSTPGTCGGKPRIDGHRIKVQDIVYLTKRSGMSVEEVVRNYPGLTMEKVNAALEYFQGHREEIEHDMKEEDRFADDLEGDHNVVIVQVPGKVHAGTNPNSSR